MSGLGALLACGGGGDRGADEAPSVADTARAEREWVVPLRVVRLRVEPDSAAGVVTTVATGRPLERIEDASASPGWIRVATWDDRRGWVHADGLVRSAVWSHYERALGGIGPGELRPAHPVVGGWLVEIPYGSPSLYGEASAYVLTDSARMARVARIGTVRSCDGPPRRVAWLDGSRPVEAFRPAIDRVRLALPAGRPPAATELAVRPVDEPQADLADAVIRRATAAGGVERTSWWRIDGGGVWATVEWRSSGPWEAAYVGLPSGEGSDVEVRTVVAPRPKGGTGTGFGVRPVAAYETNGASRPTLFVVASNDYDGERAEVYVARSDDYGRVWTGYTWSCGR